MKEKTSIKKTYEKEGIKVVWESSKCRHAGRCVRQLKSVFHPDRQPWINLEGADNESIRKTVLSCPSGALSLDE